MEMRLRVWSVIEEQSRGEMRLGCGCVSASERAGEAAAAGDRHSARQVGERTAQAHARTPRTHRSSTSGPAAHRHGETLSQTSRPLFPNDLLVAFSPHPPARPHLQHTKHHSTALLALDSDSRSVHRHSPLRPTPPSAAMSRYNDQKEYNAAGKKVYERPGLSQEEIEELQ